MLAVVVPCSLVVRNQRFGVRAASIFRIEFRDQGDLSTALFQQSTTISLLSPWKSRTSLCRQQCNGYSSLIKQFNPEDGDSTASETLVSNHKTTQRNNPEKHASINDQFHAPAASSRRKIARYYYYCSSSNSYWVVVRPSPLILCAYCTSPGR
jgi:hypothetical protein